jgi:hypothetical protein
MDDDELAYMLRLWASTATDVPEAEKRLAEAEKLSPSLELHPAPYEEAA